MAYKYLSLCWVTTDVEKYMRVQTKCIKIETKVCGGPFYIPTLHFSFSLLRETGLIQGNQVASSSALKLKLYVSLL